MTYSDPDPAFDPFLEDFVAYLARRLGVPYEVALGRLGDWLVTFDPQSVPSYGLDREMPD